MIYMLTLMFKLLGYIPMKWWKNGGIGFLTTTSCFFLVGNGDKSLLNKYLELLEGNSVFYFILYWALVYILFYVLIDFLIRFFFNKKIKKNIICYQNKNKGYINFDELRDAVIIKQTITEGVNLPFELGYIKRRELPQIDKPVVLSDNEKEEAINEIIAEINVWVCIGIHLILTAILVWQYNWILMLFLLTAGIFVMLLVYTVITFVIKNIEGVKSIHQKLKFSTI